MNTSNLRVLPYHGNPKHAEHNVHIRTEDGVVNFRDRRGHERTIPEGHCRVLELEELYRRDLHAEQDRLAAVVRAELDAAAAGAKLAAAESSLRTHLVVAVRARGVPGGLEREPYLELVERGVARQPSDWRFVLAQPQGDFLPAEHVDGLLWIADDPALGSGPRLLVGWRGSVPVAASFHGGAPIVVDVPGRWSLPTALEEWRDWLLRVRSERADVDGSRAVLERRLRAGATVTPRDSEEAAALSLLVDEAAAVEITPRTFVAP